ncbi:STE like transcription factor-domain-containing protein [Radiomyces spectabilis]|uniref:STE like transcription factor-domain-containing protein n=1 Tax=Radiomyces spectabilis TaxID=64574 RepID=UPI00221FAAC5|nr:STE like transcription factor-domain-containing protein [Radiomyces spectabilis]KAI8377543.1 STE like transcription factor-domain-containing protein [Radiomyces spectabilis]
MTISTKSDSSTRSHKKQSKERDTSIASFGMPAPTAQNAGQRSGFIENLKFFFATATQNWDHSSNVKRFELPTGEAISCILWSDHFFISGTDIVRSLTFRFHAFGRPVTNPKKFEEGVFSDLRNLKPGTDARLEEPKSELLDMLYKNNCIRTQKKQKVFFWFSVPHDRLFLDALERDLKREKMGMEPTSTAVAEPASSISLDTTQELFDQLRKNMSISAAATAQALKDELGNPTPLSSVSMNSLASSDGSFSSDQLMSPTDSQIINPVFVQDEEMDSSWMWTSSRPPNCSPTIMEPASRASTMLTSRRSRVNSVPANLGQQQQLQFAAHHHHHRLSHASSYLTPSASRSRSRHRTSSASSMMSSPDNMLCMFDDHQSTAFSEISKSTMSKPKPNSASASCKSFGQELVDGVDQLDIASPRRGVQHSSVISSKSLDANAIKKTKAIFGNLSLFEGSPSYKQRRRRAASMSSSALQQAHTMQHAMGTGGPDRIRRHANCHTRTTSSNNTMGHSMGHPPTTSRLALAAAAAGFGNKRTGPMPSMNAKIMQSNSCHPLVSRSGKKATTDKKEETDCGVYTCSVEGCNRLFRRLEHLDRHLNLHQNEQLFVCSMCGKRFPCSDALTQHYKTHDTAQNELSHADHGNDGDDSSMDDFNPNNGVNTNYTTTAAAVAAAATAAPALFAQQQQQQQHHQQQQQPSTEFYSPRHSFDSCHSRTSAVSVSSSLCSSSRCSTLSPTLDLDFEMPSATMATEPTTMPTTTTTTTTTTATTTALTTTGLHDEFLPTWCATNDNHGYQGNGAPSFTTHLHPMELFSRGMMTNMEDDFSSSSSSSPTSVLQSQQQTMIHGHLYEPLFTGYDLTDKMMQDPIRQPSLTLLSAFKPEFVQEDLSQPPNSDFSHLMNHGCLLDNAMLTTATFNPMSDYNIYDPYNFPQDINYAPSCIAPSDVSMTFY